MTAEQRDSYAVDKSAWGDGPWQSEPDRVDWIHTGLACLALRHPDHGHWCGYVGVPREHPLYGSKWEDGLPLDCHGGVNYAAPCDGSDICHVPAAGMPDDVWWFGSDFGHIRDLSPGCNARLREALAASPDAPWASVFRRELEGEPDFLREVYRELPYVRAEVERLAEQLAALTLQTATIEIA
jgi:hypothetical protein